MMTVQTHWFRDHPAIVGTLVGFVMTATVLYLLIGRVGILYALGFVAFYLLTCLLTNAFGSLLDPDVY
jgi:hypothetical protein